jgi:DNA-binding response OmpR family regulator
MVVKNKPTQKLFNKESEMDMATHSSAALHQSMHLIPDEGTIKAKILLVEDDFFLGDIYQTKLAVEHFDVSVAQDGVEGVRKAVAEQPDLILLDIMLPKMDGLEVLKKLKEDEKTKHIPVILLSNLGQDFVVKGGIEMGAVDYLLKSDLTPREVIQKIKLHLHLDQDGAATHAS